MANFGSIGASVGSRFNLISAVPAAVLLLMLQVVVATGAFSGEPTVARLAGAASSYDLVDAGLFVTSALLLALLANPFHFSMVQLLEGYWPTAGPSQALAEYARARHSDRRRYHRVGFEHPTTVLSRWDQFWLRRVPSSPSFVEARRQWHSQEYARYPVRSRLMPTTFGNALRYAEDFAGDRYGINALNLLPYLLSATPQHYRDAVNDIRNGMDVAVSFVYVWVIVTVTMIVAFIDDGPWLAVAAVTFGLAWSSYQGAVSAARVYGRTLVRAFDLYRFDMLRQLHFRLPETLKDELETNAMVARVIGGNANATDLVTPFSHPDL